MSTFKTDQPMLPDLVRDIVAGKIQLPDFQRGWVWDDEHVRSLLVSIARSFPVGAVMLLDTGGDVRFQVRPIENVTFDRPIPEPEKLILDGQQRLTSLTQVLALDKPVNTFTETGKKIRRFYYIDIRKALEEGGLDEAFVGLPEDRKRKEDFDRRVVLDLSTPTLECEQLYFPCHQILNSDDWEESLQEHAPEHFGVYMQFRKTVLNAFRSYQLPVIALGKSTSKEAVCLVFEKVNTGGVSLSVFELVTASFAAEEFNLRDDWHGSEIRKIGGRAARLKREPMLAQVQPTDFLQAITLLKTREQRLADIAGGKTGKAIAAVSAKRASVLALEKADYERFADRVEAGFMLAAKFLRKECFHDPRDLPYRTQVVPLAAVLTLLGERWLEPRIYEKLARWYWCGVLGELYGGAVETRMANDLDELIPWIEGDGEEPRTIYEASFQPGRLNTLRSRLSAAYKALNVLVLREGAEDFFWKAAIRELEQEEISLDIHHIFPRAWCEERGIKPGDYNSIVNKTPISYKANRMIGAKAPSRYLNLLQGHKQVDLDDEGMDAILESHLIDPKSLRADDFQEFYRRRAARLLDLVEKAMGKTVTREAGFGEDDDYLEDLVA